MLNWLIDTFGQSLTAQAARDLAPTLIAKGVLKPEEVEGFVGSVAFLEKIAAREIEKK